MVMARKSLIGILPASVRMTRPFSSLNLVMIGGRPSLNKNLTLVPCLQPVCIPLIGLWVGLIRLLQGVGSLFL